MEVIIPISICVIMPISIVLIVAIKQMKANQLRADIILKAIESDTKVDIEKLAEALGQPKLTPQEMLTRKLMRGCIFTLIGIMLCIFGIINCCNGAVFHDNGVIMPILLGSISFAIGLSFLIVYFVNRSQVTEECEKVE